jgi:glucosamine-phosphate N-acetyltransferase
VLVFVERKTDRIVASGTVFTERKFLRNTGKVGHIEDIAVDSSMHGKGLGKKLILALEEIARSQGCYKTILDCSKDNIRTCSNPLASADIFSLL